MGVAALIIHQARFIDTHFWRDYGVTMRPYLLFVSGITGVAGLSLAGRLPLAAVLPLSVVFFLSYGFGQALTDCFQRDTDSLSAPYRPMVRGSISPKDVAVVSLLGLAGGAVVVTYFNWVNVIPASLAIFGLATYTHFKRRWWGGPWYNAWIVSLVVLMGYLSGVGATAAPFRISWPLAGTMLTALAAYANFVLVGYYKDISADRRTGYQTLPVVFGRRVAAVVSDGLAGISFVGAAVVLATAPTAAGIAVATPFVIAAVVAMALAQYRLHSVRTDEEAHRAVGPVVDAYVLIMAGLAAAHRPTWVPALVGCYFAFRWTMQRRPMREQI
jgi:4-hydroxybenzoate polyprenyltransferase